MLHKKPKLHEEDQGKAQKTGLSPKKVT